MELTLQRLHVPQHLKPLLKVIKFVTLYLLKKYSPTQILFSDALGNQHLVNISNKVSCSCLPGNYDHCLHTLYTLNKLYKIDQSDPWLYQRHYTNHQIQMIVSGERSNLWNQIHTQTQHTTLLNQSNHPPTQPQPLAQFKQSKQQLPTFQQQQICSICHQKINNETPIISCKSLCRNNFHCSCLQFWINHKRKQNLQVSCPMCRSLFSQLIETDIKAQQQNFISIFQSHHIKCNQCSQDILIKLFKCLLCQDLCLCYKCYMAWKHPNHDRFIMKNNKKSQWAPSTGRNQFDMKKLDISLQYMKKQNLQQFQYKKFFGPNYQKFIQSNTKKPQMLQFIIESFTNVEKQVFKTYKKLQFQQKDLICCICNKKNILNMRRLPCQHFVDQKCLKFLLINGYRICPKDKKFMLPGFKQINILITK